MASNVAKSPCLRRVWQKHHYATQAAAAPATSSSGPKISLEPVKANALPNRIVVAGAENNSPISRVSIVFRAGSRFETPENLGCTHALRIAAGLGTENFTHFGIRRTIQQAGGNLKCTTGRETITYTLETTRDKIEDHLKILQEVACRQQFKPWELSDNLPRMQLELASRPPQVWAVELLHKAAFRKGLGNSIYCPKHMVGKHGTELLKHYVNGNFTGDRAAVVGLGVELPLLQNMAHNLPVQSGAGAAPEAPKFYSGEIRRDTSSAFACVAVAGHSTGLNSGKEALAFAVLQRALGIGPQVKWGSGSQCNPLSRGVQGADANAAVSALSVAHLDTGLFGFILASPGETAGKAVEAGVQALRCAADSIGETEIAKGKAQLKTALMMALEGGETMIEEIGLQAALLAARSGESTLPMSSASQIKAAVDGISSAEVKAAARKIATGKLCMSAVGDLSNVPYLDQLK